MNCLLGVADRRKLLSFTSSQDYVQRLSPSQIFERPQLRFDPA